MSFPSSAFLPSFGLSLALVVLPARADDVSGALAEAQKAYAAGDMVGAKQAADFAAQLLAQRNADSLSRFLPAAPAGWTAGDVESDVAAAAVFGGGIIARRDYRKGDETAQVQIIAQSPLVTQMSSMFANAQMLGALGRVFRIQGRTAVVTHEGTVQMMSGGAFISVEGSASEADKRAFLEAIDLAAMAKVIR